VSMGTLIPFGAWLKQRRKELGLTQLDLARCVACSLETVEKIESGKRRPSRQIAALIAQCLGVSDGEHDAFTEYARASLSTTQNADNNASSWQSGPAPWRKHYAHPNNLPAQLNPFIGRESEIKSACALLQRPGVRLLTMTGSPGIGKTRLSLVVGRNLLGEFADGVFFVPLAVVTDPSQVGDAIITALGIYHDASRTSLDTLKTHLLRRQVLLLLDNFEHIIPAARMVAELLEASAQLKVLATSRMKLDLYGEYTFPVPPMSLPSSDSELIADFDQLCAYEAVALFTERARAARPDYELTPAAASTVVAICHKLDCLPLAIELAAAHVRSLAPEALLPQLVDKLAVLVGGASNLPTRHQTLRGAIAWSYELLTATEQEVFRRLGVFAGGCTLQAAQTVCQADDTGIRLDMEVILNSLTGKSLLQEVEIQGSRRFVMLETIREYARERLTNNEEKEGLSRCHALYFLGFAQEMDAQLRRPGELSAQRRLEADHDNLRAALRWAIDNEERDSAYQFVSALHWFWWARNYWVEGVNWLENVLTSGGTSPSIPRTLNRARALYGGGFLGLFQGSLSLAESWLTESISIARELGERHDLGVAINCLSVLRAAMGEPVKWGVLEESVDLLRGQGDEWYFALMISGMGEVARMQGRHQDALPYHLEALDIFKQLGDLNGIGSRLLSLGHIMHQEHNWGQSATYYREGIAAFHEVEMYHGLVTCMYGLSGALASLGQAALAARMYGATEALRDTFAIAIPRFYLEDHEARMVTTRVQLDAATFEAEWKAGRSMSTKQAVTYALSQ
jgi:predicted ATPase/transcriptional regulator with XRE-family HTH domain